MSRAIGRKQRQRDIVGDALGAHIVEKWKAPAFGIVDAMPDLPALSEHDRQRTVSKFRRIQQIEIRGAVGDLGVRLPDEIDAENIGVQGPDEEADAP